MSEETMDAKIFKKTLPDEPTEEDFLYWKRMLEKYIATAKIPEASKLDVLHVLCGPKTFPLVEDCTSYSNAISLLEKKFLKRSSAIMMRYKLLTRKQQPSESVEAYMSSLRAFAKKCQTKAMTAEEHRSLLVTDAFVAGLTSGVIRQRLLESSEESLDELHKIAITMEMAISDSKSFEPSTDSPTIAAAASLPKQRSPRPPTNQRCFWCAGQRHPRSSCPARNSTCSRCQIKGHWASACMRKPDARPKLAAAATSLSAKSSDSEDCSDTTIMAALGSTRRGLIKVTIDEHRTEALVDTGSDSSFVTLGFLLERGLRYSNNKSSKSVHLADKSSLQILGTYEGDLCINSTANCYKSKFCVVDELVFPMIIGMDLLRHHSKVVLSLGGSLEPLEICCALSPVQGTPTYRLLPGVDLDSLKPLAAPSRRYTRHAEFIATEIDRLLKEGIIQESQSPWRAQCFVTNTHKKPRLVIDYSGTINRFTPLDSYPSARIEDILEKVATNKIFSRIDLRSAYHQLALHPDDYKLTAFEACGRLFEWTRLPFGCTNAVAIFQRTMDYLISANSLKNTYSYLDDIIIGGRTKREHDENLAAFKKAAAAHGLQTNDGKCAYSQETIDFLGHTIHDGTMKPDARRVSPLLDFPNPKNLAQLNRLIGLFAYYAKWIPRCSETILPLIRARDTINKTKVLSSEAIAAIAQLKSLLAASTLSAPQYGVPFTIETDASEHALGGSLTQFGKPVAFMSRTLTPSERRQSVIEREACAIVECCRRWRHLLLSAPQFTIITDQKSVSFLFSTQQTSKIKNDKLARWRLELSGYRFDITYRCGAQNTVADALSRITCASTVDSQLLLTLHGRLCHPGVARFYHYVRARNLPYSLSEVRQVVSSCDVCKELKPRYYNPPRANVITSTRPWERLSIDFVGPLPSSSHNKYLLVIVDEFSRYPFAFPCSRITDDVVITHLLNLFSMFGTPAGVHSDRGAQFESTKLKQFLLRNGIAKTRTTPYRPEGNGQCERMNGTLQKTIQLALKTFGYDKTKWERVLAVALSSIRSLLCTATNSVPHDRLFTFRRSSVSGSDLPEFLLHPGSDILHRRHIHSKGDEPAEKVELVETVSPHYARIKYPTGRVDTVSTRDLAPCQQRSTPEENTPERLQTPPTLLSNSPNGCESPSHAADDLPEPDNYSSPESPKCEERPQGYTTRYGRTIKAPDRYQS